MKICYVSIDSHMQSAGGGIASYLSTMACELSTRGHEATIICPRSRSEVSSEKNNGFAHEGVHLGNLHYYISRIPLARLFLTLPVRELEWSFQIWRLVSRLHKIHQFDLIESCETGNLFSLVGGIGVPWIIRAHGATYSFSKYSGQRLGLSEKIDRMMQRYCMRRAQALSAPSRFQAKEIEEELNNRTKVTVVPNPIDQHFLMNYETSKLKKLNIVSPIILYTGRIEIRKGTIVLIKSMRLVTAKIPGARLMIAGERHVSISQTDLDELLTEDGIRGSVTLLGHVPWHKLKQLYEGCDLFAIPSYYETFCISAAEAMACSRPVVGCRGTALDETVVHGVTGLLVPPGNERLLAEAMIKLLEDPSLAESMGREGRRRAEELFSPSVVVERMLTLYQAVAAEFSSNKSDIDSDRVRECNS